MLSLPFSLPILAAHSRCPVDAAQLIALLLFELQKARRASIDKVGPYLQMLTMLAGLSRHPLRIG